MKKVKKINVAATLQTMEVGDEVGFSMRETTPVTVRAAACELAKRTGVKITVRQSSRELKTFAIRIK